MPGPARRSPPRRKPPSSGATAAAADTSNHPESGPRPTDSRGPDAWLALAINAETTAERRERALRGIEANDRGEQDSEFHCLLLRQLFLAEFEDGHYEAALATAEKMIDLGELADVARQDAARACLALEDLSAAVGHLRIAGRACPPSRRAFHDWTLGSLLYFDGQWSTAVAALSRAARWATTQKPLYEAQLGLAQLAANAGQPDLAHLRQQLQGSSCAAGYGELVLGELSARLGDREAAQRHLTGFIERVEQGRQAKAVTLRLELAHARRLLAELDA